MYDLGIFWVVKGKMHIPTNPNGPPALVFPRERFEMMDAAEPRHWEPVDTLDENRVNELYTLANVLENVTADWSPDFSYFRAAAAVRALAVSVGNPPPPILGSWVGVPSAPRPPRAGFRQHLLRPSAEHGMANAGVLPKEG